GEHARQPLRAHLVDTPRDIDDTGVVDQAGERPELAVERRKETQYVALERHVGLQRDRRRALRAQLVDQRARRRLVAGIVDGQRIAALRTHARSGSADATAAASDQRDPLHLSSASYSARSSAPKQQKITSPMAGACPSDSRTVLTAMRAAASFG